MAYSSYKIAFSFVLSHRCALFGDAGMFSPTRRLLGAGVKGQGSRLCHEQPLSRRATGILDHNYGVCKGTLNVNSVHRSIG